MELREYQKKAVAEVERHWAGGAKAVLMAGPPGIGKTELGGALCKPRKKSLVVVHRRELAVQAIERYRKFGFDVGAIMGGYNESPSAKIVVAMVQSLLGHPQLKGFELVHFDEAHHYAADKWDLVRAMQTGGFPKESGATATPERDDGRPLDTFDEIVTVANYTTMIDQGHLVRPNIIRPKRNLDSNWAKNPLDAWAQNGYGKAILWVPSIELADHYAEQANLRRIKAASITENTSPTDRAQALHEFEHGDVQLLTNVGTLLEGVNLPCCDVAILGRSFRFVGTYLQATGRVLRPWKTKTGEVKAKVIDLTGATIRHQHPCIDREYSLGEEPISGGGKPPPRGEWERTDPLVVDVAMEDDYPEGARPEPMQLPNPDPEWWEAQKKKQARYQRNVSRYGEAIARMTL